MKTLIDSPGMLQQGMENSCSGFYLQSRKNNTMFYTPSLTNSFSKINLQDFSNNLITETHRLYNSVFGFKNYSYSYNSGISGSYL